MAYDNLCKYLSEKYPDRFASWILAETTTAVEVLKTELSIEPIRADSVTFLRTQDRILHLEFQVKVPTEKPMPLRMLNYWLRLYWQYELPVTQVLIWLKPTTNRAVFENQFELELTRHGYQVRRMWEQSPEPLLQEPALLPLAALAATEDASQLLSRVAEQITKIESLEVRQEISSCTQILAGLRFDKDLIDNFFRKEIMQESVIYQDIIQKGLEQGRQAEVSLIVRQLTRRIGKVDSELSAKIRELSFSQLEDLGEALLDFESVADLVAWFQEQQSRNR